jgi:hypothetical protein
MSPSSAKVKNVWRYVQCTSTRQYSFVTCTGRALPLFAIIIVSSDVVLDWSRHISLADSGEHGSDPSSSLKAETVFTS